MFDQYGRFIPTSIQAQQMQNSAQKAILPNGPPDGGRQQYGQLQFGPQIQSIGARANQSPSAQVMNSQFQNRPDVQIQRTQAQNVPKFQLSVLNQPINMMRTGQAMPQGGGPYSSPPQQSTPMPPQQSVIQSVNNNDPQSVQNFLQALKQVGAGGNNTFMHNGANQGQQAQAGFTGFSNTQAPQALGYYGSTVYGGGQNGQMGRTDNRAYGYGNSLAANQAQAGQFQSGGQLQQGGKGGVAGQPDSFYKPDYTRKDMYTETWADGSVHEYYNDYGNQSDDVKWLGGGQSQGQRNSPFVNDNYSEQPMQDYWQASDENVKTNIKSADNELDDFLKNLNAYEYEYKDPKYGVGTHVSPMAQEIEKSSLGAEAIQTNDEGYKMVNYAKLAPITLASVAYLHKKMNELSNQINEKTMKNLSKKGK